MPRLIFLMLTAMLAAQMLFAAREVCADDSPPQAEIAKLVQQLSDRRLQVRVDAERQLRQLGPRVLPEMPNPRTLDPSAAEAVRRIRTHLERQQARTALQPSLVTLIGQQPLRDVIAALSTQTGNMLNASGLPPSLLDMPLRVKFDRRPFWSVLQFLEEQAGILATSAQDRSQLTFRLRDEAELRPTATTSDGPFRISVVSARLRADFVSPNRRLLRVTLQIDTEPRLRPLFAYVTDADLSVSISATEETRPPKPFEPLSPSAMRELPADRPGPLRFTYDVVLPGENPDAVKSVDVDGKIEMELAAGRERFEFGHLDEAGSVTRRHGGVSVTLEQAQADDDDLRVDLRLRYDVDGPSFESHRSWVFHNEVALKTAAGRSLRPAEYETLHEGEGGVRLRYRFADAGEITSQTKLVYTAPTLITRVPVKFALKDVPVSE